MKKSGNHAKGRDAIRKEYKGLSHQYDSRWSFYVEATHQATLTRLPRPQITKDGRLLDVGCGTGILLKSLSTAYPGLRLTGIDPTKEMLEVARRRLGAVVPLEQAWAENLPFRDETFDIVVSCNIFHYIREPVTALRESRRVLKPGGVFLMTDWCHDFFTCRVCGLYLRLFSKAHFKIYGHMECYDMLAAAGFGRIEIERYKVNWLWGLMTALSYRSAD